MKTQTEILHVEYKTARNGSNYRLVHMLIQIVDENGTVSEFVRKFAVFTPMNEALQKQLKKKKT